MASASVHKPAVTFFEMREEGDAFMASVTKLVGQLIRQKNGERVPVENHQVFMHGRTWRHPANERATTGEMQTHGAEFVTPFDDIVGGDFNMVPRFIASMVQQFDDASARMLYESMAEICEANGQTVDGRDKSFPEAFMEAFRKIEFGVDRDGNVSLPEVHVGSMKMVEQLQAMGEEYQAEFERLKQEKIERAEQAEEARRSKFKSRKV